MSCFVLLHNIFGLQKGHQRQSLQRQNPKEAEHESQGVAPVPGRVSLLVDNPPGAKQTDDPEGRLGQQPPDGADRRKDGPRVLDHVLDGPIRSIVHALEAVVLKDHQGLGGVHGLEEKGVAGSAE